MSTTPPNSRGRKVADAAAAQAQRDAWLASHNLGKGAVDLSEARTDPAATAPAESEAKAEERKRQPPGWNACARRMEDHGNNVYAAADSLGIFPRAAEVLQDRVISTLYAGAEARVNRRLGALGRLLVGRRRREALVTELAGFAYGNALTLLIVGVEAERERKSRGKAGHR